MAQQIVIDIVAETKKLTQGLNDAQTEIGTLNNKVKGLASAAGAAASAFVLKEGISFLKQGIDEARDAKIAMNNAESAFGKGSEALRIITEDAEKFGKALGIDNDDIIKLATTIGSRLPKDAKNLSAKLVDLGKDIEAFTGGAITAESFGSKLAKAFADGEISAKELRKIVPGLSDATYNFAEKASKAGKNQEALSKIIQEAQKKYGDAAEKNVTSTQKFETALANLKESVGTKILPIVESLVENLVKLIDAFDRQPKWLQNFEIGLLGLVGIGGPLVKFVSSTKDALDNLGLLPGKMGEVGTASGLLNTALKGIAIFAIITLIIELIKNWDDVVAVAKKVYEAIKEFFGKAFDWLKDAIENVIKWVKDNWPTILAVLTGPFGLFIKWLIDNKDEILQKAKDIYNTVKDWLEDNWPKILAVLTGPFGLFVLWLVKHKDELIDKFKEIWESAKTAIGEKIEAIKTSITDKFNEIKDALIGEDGIIVKLTGGLAYLWGEIGSLVTGAVEAVKTGVTNTWNKLKDKTNEIFTGIETKASEIWNNIKDYIIGVVKNVLNKFSTVKNEMIEVGKDIAKGIIEGILSLDNWFKDKLKKWIDDSIIGYIRTLMKISSPSKVMEEIGQFAVQGLYKGMGIQGPVGIQLPQINVGGSGSVAPINVTINAGLGTDPYALGRAVDSALSKYATINSPIRSIKV